MNFSEALRFWFAQQIAELLFAVCILLAIIAVAWFIVTVQDKFHK